MFDIDTAREASEYRSLVSLQIGRLANLSVNISLLLGRAHDDGSGCYQIGTWGIAGVSLLLRKWIIMTFWSRPICRWTANSHQRQLPVSTMGLSIVSTITQCRYPLHGVGYSAFGAYTLAYKTGCTHGRSSAPSYHHQLLCNIAVYVGI